MQFWSTAFAVSTKISRNFDKILSPSCRKWCWLQWIHNNWYSLGVKHCEEASTESEICTQLLCEERQTEGEEESERLLWMRGRRRRRGCWFVVAGRKDGGWLMTRVGSHSHFIPAGSKDISRKNLRPRTRCKTLNSYHHHQSPHVRLCCVVPCISIIIIIAVMLLRTVPSWVLAFIYSHFPCIRKQTSETDSCIYLCECILTEKSPLLHCWHAVSDDTRMGIIITVITIILTFLLSCMCSQRSMGTSPVSYALSLLF